MNQTLLSFAKKYGPLVGIILLTLILYIVLIGPNVQKNRPMTSDIYRDIAYATGVMNGRPIFEDPTIKGEYIWYPPLNPLIMALISRITGLSVFTIYAYSVFLANLAIPILFYLLIAELLGKRMAFFSSLLMVIMPWVNTHFFSMVLTSVHGVAVMLAVLLYFSKLHKKGMPLLGSTILGLLTGLALLHHSLSGLILYGSLFIFISLDILVYKHFDKWKSFLAALVIPVIVWAPYWIPNLFRAKLNPSPLTHLAIELMDPEFALFIPNVILFPLTVVFLITGIIYAIRRFHRSQYRLLLIILALVTLGQLPGYIRFLGERGPLWARGLASFPVLIPHEFQWFFQLFALPMIVLGFWLIFQYVSKNRFNFLKYILLALFALPGIMAMPVQYSKFFMSYSPDVYYCPVYVKWINENTPKDAVIMSSNVIMSYYDIQSYSGRPVLATMPFYMNYNVNVDQRFSDKNFIIQRASVNDIKSLVKRYDLVYFCIEKSDMSPERLKFFLDNFHEVFSDGHGVYILEFDRDSL
ncbi:MAG: glycosyltransferase family 39 protein [Spirochaetales bacterium]|nr:glycosyltransferase family 39 protein [Spirochaetales bacterium]